jgi:hypothetical protein
MKIRAYALSVLLIGGALVIDTAATDNQSSAATTAKPQKLLHKEGSVVSMDVIGNTIVVEGRGRNKPQWIFSIPINAKITQGKKSITLGDITVGSKVAVKYTKDGDTLNVSSIQVVYIKK